MKADEYLDSLTGWEEQAIAKAFGEDVSVLATTKPTAFLRSMAFVMFQREGDKFGEARARAMDTSLQQIRGLFTDDGGEGADAGKG